MNITITEGTRADYQALARYHYRAPRPATPVLTLAAREGTTLAGVLVVIMPTLNAPWRRTAWPHLFTVPPKCPPLGSPTTVTWTARTTATTINRHIRTIARVIIDPRYRALGIARRLVEHYLSNPLTTHTEAVAAMGRACPFFTRAGMEELAPPTSRRDTRLALTLRTLALNAWELVDLTRARSALVASDTLRAAILRWANDSKSTRRHLPLDMTDLDGLAEFAALAGSSLTARPLVYVHNVPRPCPVARPCSDGRGSSVDHETPLPS
ncbi:MAG TPA: GNAT family N-acetyltransferase [Phycisphaerales bacterium]|nr:GNAT family N-acetyltransferase [Phycisphaerales bacterium]